MKVTHTDESLVYNCEGGILMGDPLTWDLLTIFHQQIQSLTWAGKGVDQWTNDSFHRLGQRLWQSSFISNMTSTLRWTATCGDDGILGAPSSQTLEVYDYWVKRFEMKVSQGQDISSRSIIWFCEDFVIKTNSLWHWIDYTNPRTWTLINPKHRRKEVIPPIMSRGSALISSGLNWFIQESIPMPPESRIAQERALRALFMAGIKELPKGLPIFLPSPMGGLNIPHPKGANFVWQKRTGKQWKNVLRWACSLKGIYGRLVRRAFGSLTVNRQKGTDVDEDASENVMQLINRVHTNAGGVIMSQYDPNADRLPVLWTASAVMQSLESKGVKLPMAWKLDSSGRAIRTPIFHLAISQAEEFWDFIPLSRLKSKLTRYFALGKNLFETPPEILPPSMRYYYQNIEYWVTRSKRELIGQIWPTLTWTEVRNIFEEDRHEYWLNQSIWLAAIDRQRELSLMEDSDLQM